MFFDFTEFDYNATSYVILSKHILSLSKCKIRNYIVAELLVFDKCVAFNWIQINSIVVITSIQGCIFDLRGCLIAHSEQQSQARGKRMRITSAVWFQLSCSSTDKNRNIHQTADTPSDGNTIDTLNVSFFQLCSNINAIVAVL